MSYITRLAVVESELGRKSFGMVSQVARDLAERRVSGVDYGEDHSIVAHAASNILRARFYRETANMSLAARIEYVRALPNIERDPVKRAYTDAVECVLDRAYPDAADAALDAMAEAGDNEDDFPRFLADAYAAAVDA